MKQASDYRYLIIGGSTKCGTTSLFKYLSVHPDICAASMKESRFFLHRQNPLKSKYRLEMDGIESYGNLFTECSDRIRMEATPDYLYSDFAASNIRKCLPASKMIFILRDPVERLESWCKFAKQRALLEKNISFEDYVFLQMNITGEGYKEQHMRALEQGRYSKYLDAYLKYFDKDRVLILAFNDLKEAPGKVLKQICDFVEIDESIYKNFRFEIFNKTHAVKNQPVERMHIKITKNLKFLFHGNQQIMKILRRTNGIIRHLMRFNQAKNIEICMSDELHARLDAYYLDERAYMNLLFRK